MQIKSHHSHLNGAEYMLVHHLKLWNEVRGVIAGVESETCRTKISKERSGREKRLFSPEEMSKQFRDGFESNGWESQGAEFYVACGGELLGNSGSVCVDEEIGGSEKTMSAGIRPYNRGGFIKDRIAVEIHFDNYGFTARELFEKHIASYVSDLIDVGIGILPMKQLERGIFLGTPYYEQGLLDVFQGGRGTPPVPLVLIGIIS